MQNGGLRTRGITKTSTPEHPLITVVTVVFNGEASLEQTIQSVVNQTYDNVEYIVVDGNSTDKTLEIIKKYEDKIDYWQSEPDKGIYDAMNKGIELANGDYLLILGADDVLYDENVFKLFLEKLNGLNLKLSFYGDVIMRSDGKRYFGKVNKVQMAIRNICQQSIFYSKDCYKKQKFNTAYKINSDFEYNLKIFNEFRHIDLIVSIYNNITGVSSSATKDKPFLKKQYFLFTKYLGLHVTIRLLIYKIRRKLNIFDKYSLQIDK